MPDRPCVDEVAVARDPLAAVRDLVLARRGWFADALASRCDSLETCNAASDMIDRAVALLYARANPCGDSAVLALGGYGRREMAPQSDVDLLFLVADGSGEAAGPIADSILYPFWNSGIDVGGATRTLDDCRQVMHSDVRALTAMMDARLVAGSAGLYDRFRGLIGDHFASPEQRARFVDCKIREHARRLERYGSSIYLAQPNLKEGEGGLREMHTLMWAARAAMPGSDGKEAMARYLGGAEPLARLYDCFRFMWSVRLALHLCEGSWNDRLADSVQDEVAKRLGFCALPGEQGSQRLLSRYYENAEGMHLACERAIEMIRREVHPVSRLSSLILRRRLRGGLVKTEHGTLRMEREPAAASCEEAIGLFAASGRTGLPVDPETRGALAAGRRWREGLSSGAASPALRDMFAKLDSLDSVLSQMRECGALDAAFPEMAALFHSAQRDGLHSYTVGVHSVKAVAEISALARSGGRHALSRTLAQVKRPAVLALAAFLHDIGKGRGGDHANKGAAIAAAIASRLGFDPVDCRDVEYLVRSHLLMSILAFKRDIRDPSLIERFAQSVSSAEMLAMLYLITYADLRAVGPSVWSEWKGGLLEELYSRTVRQMAAGEVSAVKRGREAERIVKSAMRRMGAGCDEGELRRFLKTLPERYLFSVEPESLAAHFMMSREMGDRPVSTVTREIAARGCTEFSVVTKDSPGLFAKIAGVLSANGANIIDAQLYTSTEGKAIDVLWVTDSLHGPFDDAERWSRIRSELAQAVSGERELAKIVGGRFRRRLMAWNAARSPVEVTVDNDVSAMHTVVEISADDRRGLLYTIADAIHELGLMIDLARITTHVDRVIDVFYIKGPDGRKIDSPEGIERIRRTLSDALAD
ncbi:MAG: [protein-PII] uridylyltransferase [Proteobacteria bacterium]|nr:[protein-PII] uridylyltransferase [Pseudomonadota bacterium]